MPDRSGVPWGSSLLDGFYLDPARVNIAGKRVCRFLNPLLVVFDKPKSYLCVFLAGGGGSPKRKAPRGLRALAWLVPARCFSSLTSANIDARSRGKVRPSWRIEVVEGYPTYLNSLNSLEKHVWPVVKSILFRTNRGNIGKLY